METLTPAEIDSAWLDTVIAPRNVMRARVNRLLDLAATYRRHGGSHVKAADRYKAEADELREEIRAKFDPIEAPFLAEWESRGGWSRAYLVPDGHFHRSTSCRTLYPTTLISWVPGLSGHSEEEIVTAAGAMACTVCYPTAPVYALRVKADEEKRAARAAEKAARDAAKAEKGITMPDGSPLKGKYGTIKTLVTAKRELTDAIVEVKVWSSERFADHPNRTRMIGEYTEIGARLAYAISVKTGVTTDEVFAEHRAKAEAKYRKDYRGGV